MKKIIILILIFYYIQNSTSQTTLPAIFGNDMILQRNTEASIWGTDTPNTPITIQSNWGKEVSTTANALGKWKVNIPTPEAGGPYQLKITGTQKIVFKNVMVGEVWLCSGQSNMEMPMKGFENQPINNSNEAILNAKNNNIRLFTVQRNSSEKPVDTVMGNWSEANSKTVKDFSATAYFFGKKLQEVLNIPIGLIHSSWGGTSVESWVDNKTLTDFGIKNTPDPDHTKSLDNFPGRLYKGMIHPIVDYDIKGVIWYQGESNRKDPISYKKLFSAMIDLWRSRWNQDNFPFYFVQIAPYDYTQNENDKKLNINSAFLREAQLQTFQSTENTGMVVTMDIGDCDFIHPREKKTVGDRLAYWALAKNYGMEAIAFSAPMYKKKELLTEGRIKLYFDLNKQGFSSYGKDIEGFKIAGSDQKFYPANAEIHRDKTITVWSDKVKNPVAVRYAFENCVNSTLFSTDGLPVSSFRTDDWKL